MESSSRSFGVGRISNSPRLYVLRRAGGRPICKWACYIVGTVLLLYVDVRRQEHGAVFSFFFLSEVAFINFLTSIFYFYTLQALQQVKTETSNKKRISDK